MINKENAEQTIKAITLDEVASFNIDWFFMKISSMIMTVEEFLALDKSIPKTACIAGIASILSGAKNGLAWDVAQAWLELDDDETSWLFEGHFSKRAIKRHITKEEAIEAIQWLIDGHEIFNDTLENIKAS